MAGVGLISKNSKFFYNPKALNSFAAVQEEIFQEILQSYRGLLSTSDLTYLDNLVGNDLVISMSRLEGLMAAISRPHQEVPLNGRLTCGLDVNFYIGETGSIFNLAYQAAHHLLSVSNESSLVLNKGKICWRVFPRETFRAILLMRALRWCLVMGWKVDMGAFPSQMNKKDIVGSLGQQFYNRLCVDPPIAEWLKRQWSYGLARYLYYYLKKPIDALGWEFVYNKLSLL